MTLLVHKAHREELECVLQVLEKSLILLPELLGRRWQCHSLTRIMTKLLHPGNSWKLRRESMRHVSLLSVHQLYIFKQIFLFSASLIKFPLSCLRYFLLWYQALGDTAPNAIHAMFATLVPGFTSPFVGVGLDNISRSTPQGSTFHDTSQGTVHILSITVIGSK